MAPPVKSGPRFDNMINVPKVRVIDDEGENLGVMFTREAIEQANEKGLNLVEVSPNADPPVCKFLDVGKYRFEAQKKANLARKAAGGDRDVARDILAGICDIGIANAYYVGRMKNEAPGSEQRQWGDAIKVIRPVFAGAKDGGTHVNISGAAVAKHAPNRANAVKLLEYLVSDQAQSLYAKANYEYPVKAGVELDPVVASFGPMKVDALPLTEIAKHRKQASELVDRVGFDN